MKRYSHPVASGEQLCGTDVALTNMQSHNRPVMRGTFRLLLVAIALVAVGAGCTGIKVDQSVSPMRLLLPGLLGG